MGSYICSDLARKGSQIIAPFRSTENDVQHLKQMGDLGQVGVHGACLHVCMVEGFIECVHEHIILHACL